jgi:hypothetical protein
MHKYQKGDLVRLNVQGAKIEEVMDQVGVMIRTYGGNDYHHSKIIRVCGGTTETNAPCARTLAATGV